MKLSELFKQKKATLSFEVFPPKSWDAYNNVKTATEEIARLSPDFMSVTYGAGGGASATSASIAENILKNFGVTPLAHLTCVSSTKQAVREYLAELSKNGIENILALRGDIPNEGLTVQEYRYASELILDIKAAGNFCIGGACYPEGHTESKNQKEDIRFLKEKVDMGCDFLTTQMFFDNNILYNFLYKIREAGINVPVVAGIMPVTNGKQIQRIVKLSGTYLPQRFKSIVDRFGDNPSAMKQAGIAYATDQIIDLVANGVENVHVYTMNKPDVAAQIQANLSEILK
ncbi:MULTISPECIES: methylenetetrahydrofolate reductase [NAD(P)H] [Congzhengia]|uniref:Methylenetetrahydrofolate reductase n=1 Tax=Congzhengia minquanensis TaxID=2763657 RepID=A0A926DNW9_9FIRM|nr:methylenetetrahydrofolate reductase [NAD(P)H] [Congzhengia minquanensis]MBC8541816.1 methylenetetrahydrofolate reductase [NAD(P)H] [Congzhengia minquanensis]MBD8947091.1 methylenetetrahydrofolate reductase [NAD(P)H] [Clostridiales bacterium]HBL81104.1 methylenetetrahydrofolate reductase [NAD(P)H] [Clostridiales bacterium]